MDTLELLLRKYANNFLLLNDITNNTKIEYLNFKNIIRKFVELKNESG